MTRGSDALWEYLICYSVEVRISLSYSRFLESRWRANQPHGEGGKISSMWLAQEFIVRSSVESQAIVSYPYQIGCFVSVLLLLAVHGVFSFLD